MAKRTARSDLNADNWDQDEEAEEAGVFKQAAATTIANRTIKKAKRRGGAETGGSEGGSKAFSGFAGFAPAPAGGASTGLGLFNGTTSQTTTPASTSIFSGSSSSLGTKTTFGTGASGLGLFGASSTATKTLTNGHSEAKGQQPGRSKYLQQLKALNESVTKWIQNHVEKNPYCILTPIFTDYEKYLDEINKKFPEDSKKAGGSGDEVERPKEVSEKAAAKQEDKKDSEKTPSASSSEKSDEESSSKPAESTGFSFGNLSSTQPSGPSSGFKFGSLGGDKATTSGSGFSGFSSLSGAGAAGTSGFSFAASKLKAEENKDSAATEDDEYVPPKPEVSQVTEEDAVYSKKCKLFYKKDDAWKEKGVGLLHLKPCGEKTQLLVRADTSLGNILLNIMLTNSIPMSRQGKNNVTLICVPNPPLEEKKDGEEADKKPVSMLIRVKTGEDADELLDKLTEAKR